MLMKRRLAIIISTYLIFLLIFVLQKPMFMLATVLNWTIYDGVPFAEWLKVMWHGLPLDLSLSGYLTAIPALLTVASVWTQSRILRRIASWYFLAVSLLMAFVFVLDTALYPCWGFKLDTTPFFYFFTSPADALASLNVWMIICGCLMTLLFWGLYYALLRMVPLRLMRFRHTDRVLNPIIGTVVTLLATGLLFIPIRGGFTVSTMNVGKVYFSPNPALNHAATNPMFSLMESLARKNDFVDRYRFMDDADASLAFGRMLDPSATGSTVERADSVGTDTVPSLFTTSRPDIVFVILESFSNHLMAELGGEPGVAVNLDSLSKEGVLFTNFFANSFRTDRGLVSILSGYPAQPTTSIMKYPRKTQNLPSIAGALKKAGYDTRYYYGGDADFTNMRSYLVSAGFDTIVSDVDFPVKDRLSKWGVHDHIVFDRLLSDMKSDTLRRAPRYTVMQTSSSHEPFEVPYSRLENRRLNAFAYTDSCVGAFVDELRHMPRWDSTLVLLVPDHLGAYPEGISNFVVERYRIPLIFVGGAVREPMRVEAYGSQHDLAATLLGQLGLFVHVHLADLDVTAFAGDLVHDRRNHLARTAPVCIEVDQHRLVRLHHFCLKIFLCQSNHCHMNRPFCVKCGRFSHIPIIIILAFCRSLMQRARRKRFAFRWHAI